MIRQPKLYDGADQHAWHSRRWPQFSELATSKPLVVLPIYSLTDWGMERPLDAEELVGAAILNRALEALPSGPACLVLPPFRFTPRLSQANYFAVDVEAAHRALEETVLSAARSGAHRIVLYNTSPLLEEWIDVAARDIRVNHNFQMFCLNLSGIGLDFHPCRGGDRSGLQSILDKLTGLVVPAAILPGEQAKMIDPIPGTLVHTNPPLAGESYDAGELLGCCADHLAALLCEIDKHPALKSYQPNPKETE